KIGLLLIPRALGACVYQVNVFISTILASLSSIAGEGAVAALYYANRVWQLPLAIFGIALAQAALPAMSRHVVASDMQKMKETVSFSLRVLVLILVPSTVGLALLRAPIIKLLFERGAFTAYSTSITADALFFYSLGLAACGGIKVLVSAFYSMRDTVTPLKTAGLSLAINVILNLALMFPLKIGGLALATSLSAIFNFTVLYVLLERRVGNIGTALLTDSIMRVTAASFVMGASLALSVALFNPMTVFTLIFTILAGILVFGISGYLLAVREIRDAFLWISKRR
ncbi:MAG TPA: lipid II flippase MurJ, partial [Candidatus Omnitrophota bacterium]|nr:lipid II flippase MurJ [Candidatus Omnitrophota bacterium]